MPPLKLGILGYPLHHTLSPVLHQFLMQHCGLLGTYEALETPPERLAAMIEKLRATGYQGVNVTIPHKVAMLDLVEVVDPLAQAIGAINTVVFAPDDTATGYNTDATGFMASLPPALKADLAQRPALVLGAGGAARAVVAGLIQAQVPALTLAVRNPSKAQDLVALAHAMAQRLGTRPAIDCIPLTALDDNPAQQACLATAGFVVNTTPLGMAHTGTPYPTQTPLSHECLEVLPTGTWVIDLIYRPRQTQLLQDASAHGHPTQDGLAMLVHQGLQAFTLWTAMSVENLADDAYTILSEALKAET